MKKQIKQKHKLLVKLDLKKTEKYHFVPQLKNVFFPYEPYPQQIDIVAGIQKAILSSQNALIESPTGTGKTLCLLVGALSSLVDSQSRKKIFYLTRTHSQISQVVSQFRKTVYSCHLNILASRQQFCVNQNLSKLKGKMLQKACEDMCFQKLCTYKENTVVRRPRQALQANEFKEYCRKQLTCPYFFSKQLIEASELTILPFNYLLEWSLFERSSIDIKDAIIIFDEAHNIDSLCQQGSDIRLSHDLMTQSLLQLKSLSKAQNSKTLHPQFKDRFEDRQETLDFKMQLQLLANKIKTISESQIMSRDDILHKFQKFTTTSTQIGVDLGNYKQFVSRGKKIIKMFYRKQIQCENIQLFLVVFEKIFDILGSKEQFQKFTISMLKSQLLFRCLDPSLCFSRIAACKPRSIILSSGTLGDLDHWQKNLKLQFKQKITADSFVDESHLYAQVKAKSQKGMPYNFNFQGKNNEQQFQHLTQQFAKLQSIIKGGIVVAFSSYQLLEKTIKYANCLSKPVYFQSKGASIEDIFSKYQQQVSSGTGFLFIVTKGRFSEGINFTGYLCRCLIVVGIPFLPLKDPGVVQKMKYLENNCSRAQAEEWYSMESFKALNQTLGRAIRNKEDYAVILLYDQRYNKEQYINNLSKWFSKCLRAPKNGIDDIKAFMKNAEEKQFERNSKVKTSSKNKQEPMLAQRLAEFSTPAKSKRLKLCIDSDEKSQQIPKSNLKETIIIEQPSYKTMKKEFQDYFLQLPANEELITSKNGGNTVSLEQEEETVSQGDNPGNMIKIMSSYKRFRQCLDF